MLAFRHYPRAARHSRALSIESDLPEALRSLATCLSMHIPFEQALQDIASSGYACSPEFALIARDVQKGASVREALSASAERIHSITYKRAMGGLSSVYEQGAGADLLKRLADDLVSQQLSLARHFSSRLVMASLLFIAAACIVPSLLLAYLLVGSSFLSLSVQPIEVWLLFLVGFPAVDLAIIAYVSMSSPFRSAARALPSPLSHAEFTMLGRVVGKSAHALKRRLTLYLSAGLFATLLLLYYNQPLPATLAFTLPFLYYFYLHYKFERRIDALERYLPDALLQASSLEKGTGAEQMLDSLARSGFGPLSAEFAQVRNSVRGGQGIPAALNAMAEHTQSRLLKRTAWLMAAGYSVGTGAYSSLREAADDMLSVFSLMRERSASLSMQKYTLLAGAVLVPLILGTLLGAILGLDVSFSFDEDAASNAEAIGDAAASAAPIYILIYAFLSSLLIAQLEGGWRRFIPYALILLPLSLVLFELARTYPLFSVLA